MKTDQFGLPSLSTSKMKEKAVYPSLIILLQPEVYCS
uniref:Uncharacterized protein n=1 Tax=Anguilla anguilla TaxID=7936 RepID=A0A0E9SA44_ANGAN